LVDVSLHFTEPSVPPILQSVVFSPSPDVQIGAAAFSGGFTPTRVPEPGTWVMLLLGLAGFGLAASRKGKPSNKTAAEAGPGALKATG
jgi:hypothetical protein